MHSGRSTKKAVSRSIVSWTEQRRRQVKILTSSSRTCSICQNNNITSGSMWRKLDRRILHSRACRLNTKRSGTVLTWSLQDREDIEGHVYVSSQAIQETRVEEFRRSTPAWELQLERLEWNMCRKSEHTRSDCRERDQENHDEETASG